MASRVVFTTGLPTVSGMGVFIGSYVLVSKGIYEIPPFLTLLTSAACFLIGLVGLSYGILSASWENSPGSLLGFENINTNISRMRSAFQSQDKDKTRHYFSCKSLCNFIHSRINYFSYSR